MRSWIGSIETRPRLNVIRLRLDPQSLDVIPSAVAVVGFVLRNGVMNGIASAMDARLGGEASQLIRQGYLKDRWESQALIDAKGRVASAYVLFAGLGALEGMAAHELSVRMEDIVQRASQLSVRKIATHVLPEGGHGLDYGSVAAESVNGVLRALTDSPYDVDVIFSEPEATKYNDLVAVAERIVFRRVKGREVSLEVIV